MCSGVCWPVRVGNFQAMEVEEELAVSSSEPEDDDLLSPPKLVDVVFSLQMVAFLPYGFEVASKDCLHLSEGDRVCSLFQLAAHPRESVCFFVAHDTTVRWNPLQDNLCFGAQCL